MSREAAPRVDAVSPRLLHQEVADRLRAAIIRGDFRPGQRLREPELARMLALSRGPVREALRKLEQEGLVTTLPHQGASVVAIEAKALDDAIAIRRFLEERCARVALSRATAADLLELGRCLRSMEDGIDARDHFASAEYDFRFHERLIQIGDSDTIRRVWNLLAGRMRLYLNESNRAMARAGRDVVRSHRAIADALAAHDAPALERAIDQHFAETRESLLGRSRSSAEPESAEDLTALVAASLEAY
ncbi:MAG TPA: GntR family transcriptional regulator [Candidatus Limnocylindrales bacterium]|nr:GntR family transcriptional regulator [Candidatus Limnocylindrales bacterium]